MYNAIGEDVLMSCGVQSAKIILVHPICELVLPNQLGIKFRAFLFFGFNVAH